jgi:competence protein ComEA
MTTTYRAVAVVLAFAVTVAGGLSRAAFVEARDAQDKKSPPTIGDTKSDHRDKGDRDKAPQRVKSDHGDKSDRADRININTANVSELMSLTGVQKRTAEKIVEYRQAHGRFKSPEDVVKVDGIGHALYEKNRTRIVVE